jgi:hypothetical protein
MRTALMLAILLAALLASAGCEKDVQEAVIPDRHPALADS